MNLRFNFTETCLSGLIVIDRKPIGDDRGYLERLFCNQDLACIGWHKPIAQINRTMTKNRGTVRGMHFQFPPYVEMKLVTCLQGEVYDVAIDIRADSPTFSQWHGQVLSAENHTAMLIPEGFAHGFQTLSHYAEMLYFHSAAFCPDAESGLNPLDPLLALDWPLKVNRLSDRDRFFPMMRDGFSGLTL